MPLTKEWERFGRHITTTNLIEFQSLSADYVGRSRGDWIRTSDHLNPIQVRYQAALRPEIKSRYAIFIPLANFKMNRMNVILSGSEESRG